MIYGVTFAYKMANAIIQHVKDFKVAINFMCVEARELSRKGFKQKSPKSKFEAKVASWIGLVVCRDQLSRGLGGSPDLQYLLMSLALIPSSWLLSS